MKIKRKIIRIDEEKCDGCGQCVPSCAEGAIQIVDGKARRQSEWRLPHRRGRIDRSRHIFLHQSL